MTTSPDDLLRYQMIGVNAGLLLSGGNIKYDTVGTSPPRLSEELKVLIDEHFPPHPQRKILIAGSTHAGEEKFIADVFSKIKKNYPHLHLIIVPRHAERAQTINREITDIDLISCLRDEKKKPNQPTDILIINTTGELNQLYTLADIVIVGKSFFGRGGQNPVEPLLANCAVITGPHMGNFTTLMSELNSHAAIVALPDNKAETLTKAVVEMLENPTHAAEQINRAHLALARHKGAAEKTAEQILQLINQ